MTTALYRYAGRSAVALAVLTTAAEARAETPVAPVPFEIKTLRLSGAVYSIAQTPDGFLWFGTQAGLRRYDGDHVDEIDTNLAPGLPDNHVRKLFAARDGRLWMATGSGFQTYESFPAATGEAPHLQLQWKGPSAGLAVMTRGKISGVDPRARPENLWIWAFAAGDGDDLWMGTEGGLSRRHDGHVENAIGAGVLRNPVVTALHQGRDGRLWIGTAGGLAFWRAGKVENVASVDRAVAAIAEDHDGHLWIATSTGLETERDGVWRVVPAPRPSALLTDRRGRLWIGTEYGLLLLAPGQAAPIRTGISARVLALYEDREGSVWVGTRTDGVAQIRTPRVQNIGEPEGLLGEMVFSTLAARDGSMWMTTVTGISRYANGGLTNFKPNVELPPAGNWRDMAEGSDGAIWVGSIGHGLLRIANGTFTHLTRAQGLPDDTATCLRIDGDGRLWVGWEHGNLGVYAPSATSLGPPTRTYSEADGLCPGACRSIAGRQKDVLWIGSERGLSRVVNGRGSCLTDRNGLPSASISTLLEDDRGTLWAGTQGGAGIVRVRGDDIRVIPATAGLPDGSPFSLADDGRGGLWVTSFLGVFRTRRADLDGYLDQRRPLATLWRFDADDGMRSQECTAQFTPGAAFDPSGRLWVPTLKGVSILTPADRMPQPIADAVVDAALVNGRAVDAASGEPTLALPRGGADLELRFAAPTFLASGRLQLRYKLDGLDRDWIAADNRRSARYSHLGPGRYRFQVAAADDLGRPIGKTAAIDVRVPPHLYQTTAFLLTCVALAGMIAVGLHRLRIRQLEARHAAIHEERARIARDLHDNLAQSHAAIGLHLDGLRFSLADAPAEIQAMVRQTRDVVNQSQAETRQAIWDIRRPRLHNRTLRASLDAALAGVPRAPETEISLDVAEPSPDPSPMLEHELSHIVREAVVNAVRHASPRHIRVSARTAGDMLQVSIQDDGRGMPEHPVSGPGGGVGLIGMRERASRVGATLTIAGSPGAGTEITLRVPIDKGPAA